MTTTILLASDSHTGTKPLAYAKRQYPQAEFFFHCGDSELHASALQGWTAVMGNHDFLKEYPLHQIVEAGGHRFLLCHGHEDMEPGHLEMLAEAGIANACDTVCFGHTHRYLDTTIQGIRLLNPGSMVFNRDGTQPSFMEIEIQEGQLHTKRIPVPIRERF